MGKDKFIGAPYCVIKIRIGEIACGRNFLQEITEQFNNIIKYNLW